MRAQDFIQDCLSFDYVAQADVFDLLRFVFELDPAKAMANPDLTLDDSKCQSVLRRLKAHEPVAHVIGKMPFMDIVVRVSPNVLIPRPETEELGYRIQRESDWNGKDILDLCTGSGCLAIGLAKSFPKAKIVASDISESALDLAEKSAADNGVTNIDFVKRDFLDGEDKAYDLIVCNPPYIPSGEPTDAIGDPSLALFSGADGMDSFRAIAPHIWHCLKPKGKAFFELDPINMDAIRYRFESAAKAEGIPVKLLPLTDLEGKNRFLELIRL